MAAAAASQRPTISEQIFHLAKLIETPCDQTELRSRVESLTPLISKYLAGVNRANPRCRFFTIDLKSCGNLLDNTPMEFTSIVFLAKKVSKAVKYLELCKSSLASLPPRNLDAASLVYNPYLDKALHEGDVNFLVKASGKTGQIEPRQAGELFNWALANWNPRILYNILKSIPLTEAQTERLLAKAFEMDDFGSISYPLMLHQFPALSESSKAKAIQWMEVLSGEIYLEIGSELAALEEVLKDCKGLEKSKSEPVNTARSKGELVPYIQTVTTLFATPSDKGEEASYFEVPSSLWSTFLEMWERHAPPHELREAIQTTTQMLLEPIMTNQALFKKRVERLIQTANVEGSFDELLIPNMMRTLPRELIRSLLDWAEENDDDKLISFLVKHDLVNEWIDEMVGATLESDSFELIAKEVNPHKLHLLQPRTRDRVLAWARGNMTMPPLQLEGIPREEKFDLTHFMRELQAAIEINNPADLRKMLGQRECLQLSPPEFWDLITRSLRHPACLREILSSSYLKVDQDRFIGLLFETSRGKNWEALGSLIASSPFTRVPLDALLAIGETLHGAPPAITIPFEEQVSMSFEGPPD